VESKGDSIPPPSNLESTNQIHDPERRGKRHGL